MSTDKDNRSAAALTPLSIQDIAKLLARHYGLTSGKYDLEIEFQIGTGPVGPNKDELVPGVILGVKSIGLAPARNPTASSVDAGSLDVQAPVEAQKRRAPRRKAGSEV